MEDNKLAGSLMVIINIIFICWYIFVLRSVFRLSKTHPTFIYYCSMSLCEIGYMLNIIWMGIDIFFDGSILLQGEQTIIYSISWNFFIRPLKLHYPAVAINQLLAICWPVKFRVIFTRKFNVCVCLGIWLLQTTEVAVWHSLYNSDAYITHNIEKYAALFKNTTIYFSLPIQSYINIHLYIVSAVTFSCLGAAIIAFSLTKVKKRAELKLLAFSIIDSVALWSPTLMRMVLATTTKWQFLAFYLIYAATLEMNSILLPLFSTDLKKIVFLGKKISHMQASQAWSHVPRPNITTVQQH